MASGQRPFREEVAVRLVDAILHQAPMPPRKVNARISPELERIILKCLEKDPENRYQSAKELAVDLRRLGLPTSAATMPSRLPRSRRWSLAVVGALAALLAVLVGLNVGELRDAVWSRVSGRAKPARIESLAVLPLENLARDPSQDYFADGMTEALIAALARIGALRVISRTSVMQYRGAKKPLPQIAKELGVDAVIEGSVLREGDQVRIAVQLIHGPTDRHLWANSYQRELRSILTLQSEVARAIADEIKVKLTPQEQARLASARPVNPEVYESYLRGRYDLDRRSAEAARQALRHFEHALGIDPTHAPSYAALADAYMVLGTGFIAAQPATEARPKGKVAAMKALEIDPGLAEAHAALGATYLCYDWDWAAAEAELRRATELNARYAPPHQWYALLYSAMGRFDDALAAARRAQEFDPLAPSASVYTPRVLYYARRYDQAREALGKVLDLDPDFILAHFWLGRCFVAQSVRERAISELRTAVNLSGRGPVMLAALAHGYAVTGQGAEARKLLGELNELSKQRYVPSYNIAEVYAGLGERDRAFEWLEKALVERTDLLIWLKVDPVWDGLRPDARFQNLLRRIGLPL
jgi:TolB-like protein/Tfp pilus assembly protein PilF